MPAKGQARLTRTRRRPPPRALEFDLATEWAESKFEPELVYKIWRALYRTYHAAHEQFPDVDWISLIAILDVIAVARANRQRADISYLAVEMGWPRTTTLRRLQCYVAAGYLTFTRVGRHTYVDNTPRARHRALKVIDVLIDSIDHHPSDPDA